MRGTVVSIGKARGFVECERGKKFMFYPSFCVNPECDAIHEIEVGDTVTFDCSCVNAGGKPDIATNIMHVVDEQIDEVFVPADGEE